MIETKRRHLAVFCGSRRGKNPVYRQDAESLARALTARNVGIVYGGGHIGLMGALADSALESGGEVIGVIPEFMMERELAHRQLTRLERVSSMHERKARMAELADGFLALPGGYGTLEEVFEIITWAQIRLHRKPIGWLNTGGYFDPIIAWINQAVREEFISDRHRALFVVEKDVETLVSRMLAALGPQAMDTRFV